jgi:hypothetical protein
MHRSPLDDLRQIEGADPDPGLVSTTLVKLIYASREFEAKVFDSDARNGTYVVVLEGVLDISEREEAAAKEAAAAPGDSMDDESCSGGQRSEQGRLIR